MNSQIVTSFEGIATLLTKMEDIGEVDLSILENIDATISLIDGQENKILEGSDENTVSSFLSYHILRNVRLALLKMKQRFSIAKQINDNPIVAEESLSILPFLVESTEIALEQSGKSLSSGREDMVIERIRILRKVLASASMLTNVGDELQTLSERSLKDEAEELINSIKEEYSEENKDID